MAHIAEQDGVTELVKQDGLTIIVTQDDVPSGFDPGQPFEVVLGIPGFHEILFPKLGS